ncbi:MAG: hypothetical protein AB8C02_07395 [Halioglobus sp.]
MNYASLIAVTTVFCVVAGSTNTMAKTHSDQSEALSSNQIFEVNAFIEPANTIVARQNVKLIIETATSGWFTGGTHIAVPEVTGLLILQNEKFASNASERRKGDTWVIQRWTLDVYPLQSGTYQVPPMTLQVQLKTSEGIEVRGAVTTPPIELAAGLPAPLKTAKHWVSAPEFTVNQSFDRSLDNLTVGDAIEQHIQFEASDVMAMMLPVYEPVAFDGLAIYAAEPVVKNTRNRGQNSAVRSERISYIVEKTGQFTLPAQDFFWWNTRSQTLEVITLPAVTLIAGGAPVNADTNQVLPFKTSTPAVWIGIATLFFGLLGVGLTFLSKKYHAIALVRRWSRRASRAVHRFRANALPEKLNP